MLLWVIFVISSLNLRCYEAYSRSAIQRKHPGFGEDWLIIENESGKYEKAFLKGEDERKYFLDDPSDENVLFTFYSRKYAGGLNITSKEIKKIKSYNPKKKTKFITHGWMSSGRADTCMSIMKGYLKNYDVNIFIVDWSYFSKNIFYLPVVLQIKLVGKFYAYFVKELVAQTKTHPKNIHLIGHSLGAHLSGHITKFLDFKPGRITGLDPAGPGFTNTYNFRMISKNDAEFVDIIHTCGGLLGVENAIGHVDIYPNGGTAPQPGCPYLSEVTEACSHGRSWKLYAASLNLKMRLFAVKCPDYHTFNENSGTCKEHLIVGESTQKNARGNYYMNTSSSLYSDI